MTQTKLISATLFGALTADAAAMGVHWIYDVARLEEIAAAHDDVAFLSPDPDHYENVPSFFAHEGKEAGTLSHYGAAFAGLMHYLAQPEPPSAETYADAFARAFGPGGTFSGYIDRPTREALGNIATGVQPSGGADDQLPALVPAIAMAHMGAARWLPLQQITHDNLLARDAGILVAGILREVQAGGDLHHVLSEAATHAPDPFGAPLRQALTTDVYDSVAYGEVTGRACALIQGLPLAFHILHQAEDFAGAIRRNILAGGDSCGRALVIGAVMGAAHGVEHIPLDWALRLENGHDLWCLSKTLASC